MTEQLSTERSMRLPMASIREQSTSTIREVIHLPPSPGATLKRANVCLALYFDPDNDPETKAEVRSSFVKALDHIPEWAMNAAFDRWEKTQQRRPSPGEIVILAERELKPMLDELDRRQRLYEAAEAERLDRDARRVSPQAAADIMARAGFTPRRIEAVRANPMAGSLDGAVEAAKPGAHWSETAPPDDPRWEVLRRSREASRMMPPHAD